MKTYIGIIATLVQAAFIYAICGKEDGDRIMLDEAYGNGTPNLTLHSAINEVPWRIEETDPETGEVTTDWNPWHGTGAVV